MQTETTNTKTVAKKPTTTTEVTTFESAWGTEGTDMRDVLIPKILVMQGLSKMVTAESAQMGDFVNSVTGQILGTAREKEKKPVTVIPIMTFKTWVEFIKDGEAMKFTGIIPMTGSNANLPLEETTSQGIVRRNRCINFYVLVKEDITNLPYLVSFQRSSYKAGQKLATHFKTCELAAARGKPVPPAATEFSLTATKTTNDHGTFYVFDVTPSGKTTKENLQTAFEWYQVLKTQQVRVDHSDLSETKAEETIDSEMSDRF